MSLQIPWNRSGPVIRGSGLSRKKTTRRRRTKSRRGGVETDNPVQGSLAEEKELYDNIRMALKIANIDPVEKEEIFDNLGKMDQEEKKDLFIDLMETVPRPSSSISTALTNVQEARANIEETRANIKELIANLRSPPSDPIPALPSSFAPLSVPPSYETLYEPPEITPEDFYRTMNIKPPSKKMLTQKKKRKPVKKQEPPSYSSLRESAPAVLAYQNTPPSSSSLRESAPAVLAFQKTLTKKPKKIRPTPVMGKRWSTSEWWKQKQKRTKAATHARLLRGLRAIKRKRKTALKRKRTYTRCRCPC